MKMLKYDSYLKMIKNSVGTKMFRSLYLEKEGRKVDIAKNGNLSCAFFVSNVLLIFGLISQGHATVGGTIKDMERNGWKKVSLNEAKPGDVIVWEKNGRGHYHNGFYIGKKKAISNDSKRRIPIIHSWDYNGKRKIIAVYKVFRF